MTLLKTEKPVYKALLVLNLLLLAAALVMCIICLTSPYVEWFLDILFLLDIIAIVSGFLYAFNGYTKKSAMFYKGFMLLFCLKSAVAIIMDVISTKAYVSVVQMPISEILCTVVCVNLFIMTFAKDLGKRTTLGLGYSILCVVLINSIRLIVFYSGLSSIIVFRAIIDIALAGIACLFVFEKYADKTARGTK